MAFSRDARLYFELMRSNPDEFAEALSVAKLGIFVSDWNTGEIDYNSILRNAFRLPENGTVSRQFGFQYLVHPDDVEMMKRLADENVPEGKEYSFRHRMKRADGRFFPCITHIKPILDETGRATKVIGIMRDHDEIERLIDRMKRAEKLADLGNWNVDLQSRKVTWSDGTFLIYGYDPIEFEPDLDSVRQHYVDQDAKRVSGVIDEALQEGTDFEYQARIITKGGSEKNVRVVGEVELDTDGKAIGYSGTIQDVTDEVIREAKVRQSQKIESLGHMTGGAAHDFNNTLAVILGNLEILRDEVDRPQQVECVDAAISAAINGAALTRNMLSFARRAHLDPETTDINDVVRSLERWARRTLPANIETEVSLQAGLWRTDLDKSSLEGALLNLLLNARDAMPEGGMLTIETANVRIDEEYIATRHEDVDPGRYVMLAVSDNGIGIHQEELERIFEPFFTTKDVGKGSGLGLSMVQGFVKQSAGAIRVYSEPGTGTTFKLYFRARQAPKDRGISGSTTRQRKELTGNIRILLAEDELEVQKTIAKTLRLAGYKVHCTNSGDEAKSAFEADSTYELLLTDIVMPGNLQGTTLAKELRKVRSDLPVVFMSGYANEATVHGNGLRPEDIRLMKPATKADLLEAIESALFGSTMKKQT